MTRRNALKRIGSLALLLHHPFLYERGVKAIFGPGTNIPKAASEILGLLRAARE